jgi:hypothetical protein
MSKDKHLDSINNPVFNDEFYVYLFMVLVIFLLGFIAGNISHDKFFHVIRIVDRPL